MLDLPAIFLEDQIQVPGLLLDVDLLLDLQGVKVLHGAVDQVLLSLQPLVQSFLASNL